MRKGELRSEMAINVLSTYYSTNRTSPAEYVVIWSLKRHCLRLSLQKVPLGDGVVGDDVSVEVETRDMDLTIGRCVRRKVETRVLWWGVLRALKYYGLS